MIHSYKDNLHYFIPKDIFSERHFNLQEETFTIFHISETSTIILILGLESGIENEME